MMSMNLIENNHLNEIVKIDVNLNKPKDNSQIFFGMGCFWGAERKFWKLDGVTTTAVGYAGGHIEDPTYEKVCTGETGHAEVVRIFYNTMNTDFEELMKIFWESHDPTQFNRQGNDIGTQYRSIILYDDKNIFSKLESSKTRYQQKLQVDSIGDIKTEIKPVKQFYLAEDYHQKYLYKNPNGYCGLKGTGISYS
mgnify:FL=1